jgi:ferric-dicitrate binding protein FerR (iron transport regulator)
MRTADGQQYRGASVRLTATAIAALLVLAACGASLAQTAECSLVEGPHNAPEKILRCGDELSVRIARGTRYKLITREGQPLPSGAELDSGALMIEGEKPFQILTPHAIAAVRGTKWAVEVKAKQTSTLVISGVVDVKRRDGKQTVALKDGEGVDVARGGGPLEVKRWKKKRVRALLARFGQ